MEYNKNKAKGYTLPYDTPYQQHMKRVKDITSNVSPTLLFPVKAQEEEKKKDKLLHHYSNKSCS